MTPDKRVDERKGYFTFKFHYSDRDGNRLFKVVYINDGMSFDDAYTLAKKHSNQFTQAVIIWFEKNSRVEELLTQYHKDLRSDVVSEDTSDGYHTFKELYEFRKIYNAVLFNEWYDQGKYQVHKSYKHSDGEDCFGGGWFIVVATLPTGDISNHYEQKDWDLFKCEVREKAKEWDGHTATDVVERLKALTEAQTIIKSTPPISRM